jgi:dienelactone hydrolase
MAWWSPPDSKEKGEKIGRWFQSAAPPKHLPRVPDIVRAAQEVNSNIKSWGIIGYCWGDKMASLITSDDRTFKAAVQTSPAVVDASDAEKVVIPMMMLASKDEPEGGCQQVPGGTQGAEAH